MPGLSLNVTDLATPALQAMGGTIRDRVRINREIGRAVVALSKTYVADDAPSRHGTAQQLGANPTGFLGGAIDAIHFEAGPDAIVVDFPHPWFARVGHDVHIAPGPGKKFLAIPIAADAYGVRLQGQEGGTFFRGKNGGLFWGRPYAGNPKILQPLYVLVPFVDQPQDRSRLPSDEQIMGCVQTELRRQLEQRLQALASVNA